MSEANSSSQLPAGSAGPGRGAHFAHRKRGSGWAKVAVPAGALAVLIVIGVVVATQSKTGTVRPASTVTTEASITTTVATPGSSAPPTAPAPTAAGAASTTSGATTTTSGATTTTVAFSPSMSLAPNGKPYEPGDYCRRDERGMTTTAGNGSTITCKVVNGSDQWVNG